MIRTDQSGFTLVEFLVAIAITGMIAVVLTASIVQVVQGSGKTSAQLTALYDVENAARYISRDVRMARDTNAGASPRDNITLEWTDWYDVANQDHECEYYLSGGELKREYNGDTTTVAQYISEISFTRDGRFITVTVASTGGRAGVSEQRTYQIQMRPMVENPVQ